MTAGDEAAARFAAGVQQLDNGDFAAAESDLRRALELRADHSEAHYKLANACKEQGKLADAERHYLAALALDPHHAEAHNNLGAVLQMLGRGVDAAASYRRAIDAKPALSQPYLNLGRLLQQLGRTEEVQACYRQALARGLDAGVFRHLLNAALGSGPAQAPPSSAQAPSSSAQAPSSSAQAPSSYVRETFDSLAAQFDRHLVGTLDYHIPEVLSAAVRGLSPPVPLDILDLGCGTGLCGEHLRDLARRMVGVDLAPKMLERARARGCYQELAEAEIGAYLDTLAPAGFDLVVAADVFIYIGDLAQVFGRTARVLRPGGLFAFSIEQPGDPCDSFRLEPSGRYSQALAYIRRLGNEAGLTERICREVAVRKHGTQTLSGQLLVLQRAGRAHTPHMEIPPVRTLLP